MIDKIRFSKKNLSDSEIKKIVDKNHLETFIVNGISQYNNTKTKNFNGGFHIQIDAKKTLIVEGSLHKYATFQVTKKLDNFDRFTMQQAKETYIKMIDRFDINPENINVNKFEIGISVTSQIETFELLNNIKSIGDLDKEKIFYFNPKFKNESVKTTEMHKDFRLIYRTYDKIFEMVQQKKAVSNDKIIRLETIHQRVEKTFLIDFFTDANLRRLQNHFFDNWDKLNFKIEIVAPTKTSLSKIGLAKDLYVRKPIEVLNDIQKEYKNNSMTIKTYYTSKRFIENWENEKINFVPTKSIILLMWEKLYSTEKQIYTQKNKLK
ncbi:hypothetical protein [Flavobacterium psychrophilum]|uniref:hypothetical protein n=1 Tax=Flavobacterium psychrophilum TaxID=96345 RepID=UPI000B7C5171|nr:hypothetical protein [Flavobacterium psychrophilum]MCB6232068.1 hypothetical protein [Flavobacterium psychrophilum]SNA80274.1 hypothetical protein FI146_340003 [Flavobacterium psychrophilum]SNB08678.1 hypothetical protein JIP1600_1660005 [Flavobacterium psychrophilum]